MIGGGTVGDEARIDVSVKSGKTTAMFYRQSQEVETGQMLGQGKRRESGLVGQRQIIRPKDMTRRVEQTLQEWPGGGR